MTAQDGSAGEGAQVGWEDRITIVISDGQEMVRAGLRLLLAPRTGPGGRRRRAGDSPRRAALTAFDPDVLVLDLGLRGPASLAAVPELRETHPRCAIVVLALQADPELARETLALGASAFVVKSAPGAELIGAIRLVAAGRTYLSPELGARLAIDSSRRHRADEPAGRRAQPSRGRGPQADRARSHERRDRRPAVPSVRTVESHRARIQQKTRPLGPRRAGRPRARARPDLSGQRPSAAAARPVSGRAGRRRRRPPRSRRAGRDGRRTAAARGCGRRGGARARDRGHRAVPARGLAPDHRRPACSAAARPRWPGR